MIGAESQCENSRRIIEKTTTVKNKTNKNKAKTIDEAESETDDMNNVEANDDGESDEDIKSIDAEEVSSGDETRPTDQTTIDYLIDIGKILSGEANLDPDEKSEILLNITTTLDLTEKQLETCKGKNIRITVRQIMKMLHPDPPNDFKFAEVDRNHVAAVREYARLAHPREEKLYTDGDLNHAMGNLFAVKTHKQNLKLSNTE
ncbi:unnamed protein product [Rotaria socialis]|uniref:Uncharacterized protein n=2 Tax=Rotaria socialis TaxID=392032 RepID=A0A818W2W2_9BILA|nr:unnamed protein product [Rotaria socialis]